MKPKVCDVDHFGKPHHLEKIYKEVNQNRKPTIIPQKRRIGQPRAHLQEDEVRGTMRILMVDDFVPWRNYLRSLLEARSDFKVVGEAADGVEGVEKAKELQPDLVLLDVGMPRLNGIAAAAQIRKISPKSAILFVSVETSPEFVEAALEAGAKAYVAKAEAGSKLLGVIDGLGLKT